MFHHFVPSRWLHPLATLVRLSLVDLLFAASKFGKTNTENQTVDWSQCAKSDQPLLR